MQIGEWTFRFQHDLCTNRIDCLLALRDSHGFLAVLQPDGQFVRLKAGESIPKPSLVLQSEHLRAIFQGLWDGGFRPKDRRYESEIDLLKDHLQDMKRLVFERRVK